MESSREVSTDSSHTTQPTTESGTEIMGATPSVDVFARDLEEALDPESGIEEEYMPYHDAVPTACSDHR